MGLKVINPLIKAVAKKAYVAPKLRVSTLESIGLKMEQLTGDVVQLSKKTKSPKTYMDMINHFSTKHPQNKELVKNIAIRGVEAHPTDMGLIIMKNILIDDNAIFIADISRSISLKPTALNYFMRYKQLLRQGKTKEALGDLKNALEYAKKEKFELNVLLEREHQALERNEAICTSSIYRCKREIKELSKKINANKNELDFTYEAWGVGGKEELFKIIRNFNWHTSLTLREDNIVHLTKTRNDALKCLYKYKKELLTVREMQNRLNLEIKRVHAVNNAKSKDISPKVLKKLEEAAVENESKLAELAKRKQAIEEREAIIGLSDKKMINKSIKKHMPNVQPYGNQQVINQIKMLQGSTTEVAEQSVKIFAKEMGFSPELVEIKALTPLEKGLNNYTVAFDLISGKILIPSDFVENNMITATLIRHELDHFSLFADLCKSMGIENFKQMILSKYPKTSPKMFNVEFWNNAIKNAKVLSPEEIKKYTEAFEKYELSDGIARDYTSMVRYYGNPIETRAYDIQASITKSLGINSEKLSESVVLSSITRRILSAISKYEQKTGRTVNLDRRIQHEIEKVYSNEVDIYTMLNNVIKTLEKR